MNVKRRHTLAVSVHEEGNSLQARLPGHECYLKSGELIELVDDVLWAKVSIEGVASNLLGKTIVVETCRPSFILGTRNLDNHHRNKCGLA